MVNNKVRVWFLVFIPFLLLYCLTAQHGVSWQDSGEYQWRSITHDYHETVPLCRSHSIYLFIGTILAGFPSTFPHSLNMLSGIMAAVLLANLALLAMQMKISLKAALPVIVTLGLSHCFWWLSTIAEVYTMNCSFFVLELIFFIRLCETRQRKWLYWLALTNGINLSIHNFALVALAVYGVVLIILTAKKQVRFIDWLISLAAWIIGLLPFIAVIASKISQTPGHSFVYWMTDILVGQYGGDVFNVSAAHQFMKINLALSTLNFFNLLIVLAAAGLVSWLKSGRPAYVKYSMLAIFILHFVFFVRYRVPDQFTFIIPTMIMLSFFAMAAMEKYDQKFKYLPHIILIVALLQPLWYYLASSALQGSSFANRKHYSAGRDEAIYWVCPWKNNETSGDDWSQGVVDFLKPGDRVYVNDTNRYTLLQKMGDNPDFKYTHIHDSDVDWDDLINHPDSAYIVDGIYKSMPKGYKLEHVDAEVKLMKVVKE